MSAFQRIPVAQAVALLAQESAARLVDIQIRSVSPRPMWLEPIT